MRKRLSLILVLLLGEFAGYGWFAQSSEVKSRRPSGLAAEWHGKTQPAPGRAALICPVPLHPVEEVLVKVVDRVKKGQVLIKIDDEEAQAEVRQKAAALDGCRVTTRQCRQRFQRLQPLYRQGAIAAQRYFEARDAVAKAQADEEAAEAALAEEKAELEHYTITANIDGVIASLKVLPGQVSRPGTTIWGQILDLSEIDVCCEVSPAQADRLARGQSAEITRKGPPDVQLIGKVVSVGIAADAQSGLIPVLLRIDNKAGRLRCYVDVSVRFH